MKFTPMSKEEIEFSNLLEPGIYPFEVMTASDEISKAGNEMIKLKLNVFGENREAYVFDYLMEKLQYKLRHFAEATGLLAAYESGHLDAIHCFGKQGYCKLIIDQGNGEFGPKNAIKDYIKPEVTAKTAPPAPAARPVATGSTSAAAPDVPRRLTPEEFAKKNGIDPKQEFDDTIPF